jgi:hypothetical protein
MRPMMRPVMRPAMRPIMLRRALLLTALVLGLALLAPPVPWAQGSGLRRAELVVSGMT